MPDPHAQPATGADFAALLPRLRRRARRLCNCPSEADDLVQDCALRLWMRLARDGACLNDPEAYAMTLLRHRRISLWRRRRAEDPLDA
jgi:RNA polymerase sigma-70 factor (ECF subfamily)